ncbi:uncharacterized protein G2W53_025811 [Senna tora]|uniref:Uncharacterized protein n=1 Tax=Senna tora TaxID=362788 RepID=A0A834WI94_9FABA|nr:uncharacterized protein G2W53_025811 [Senna tora]
MVTTKDGDEDNNVTVDSDE